MVHDLIIEDGDTPTPSQWAEWLGRSGLTDYVENGLVVSVDFVDLVASFTAGKVHIDYGGEDATILTDPEDVSISSGKNEIYVTVDKSTDPATVTFTNITDGTTPTAPHYLKVAEVTTSPEKSYEWNRGSVMQFEAVDTIHDTVVSEQLRTNLRVDDAEPYAAPKGRQIITANVAADWTVVRGTLTEVTDSWQSTGALELENTSSSNGSWINYNFSSAQDFTGLDFSMAARVMDFTGSSDLRPRIVLDDTSNNRKHFLGRIGAASGGTGKVQTPWRRISFGFSSPATDSTFDVTSVDRLFVRMDEGDTHRWRINDIRVHPRPSKGYLMFEFDDASDLDYTNAFSILGERGFVGTSFIPSETIGTSNKLTLAQMKEMQSRGWEFAAHGHTSESLPSLSRERQNEELRRCKRFLIENGFKRGARAFRTPQSAIGGNAYELLPQYYELLIDGMTVDTGGAASVPAPLGHIGSYVPSTVTEAQGYIDNTVQEKHITALDFHGTEQTESFLGDIADYAKTEVDNGNLEVVQVTDVLDRTGRIGF